MNKPWYVHTYISKSGWSRSKNLIFASLPHMYYYSSPRLIARPIADCHDWLHDQSLTVTTGCTIAGIIKGVWFWAQKRAHHHGVGATSKTGAHAAPPAFTATTTAWCCCSSCTPPTQKPQKREENAPVLDASLDWDTDAWLKYCFTSTETVGLLGTGAQDVKPRLSHSSWALILTLDWAPFHIRWKTGRATSRKVVQLVVTGRNWLVALPVVTSYDQSCDRSGHNQLQIATTGGTTGRTTIYDPSATSFDLASPSPSFERDRQPCCD